MQGEKGEERK